MLSTMRAIGLLLVVPPTPFARFTFGDVLNPGASHWQAEPVGLSPQQPHYAGKVLILVDEVTQRLRSYPKYQRRLVSAGANCVSLDCGLSSSGSFPLRMNLLNLQSAVL